MIVQGNGAFALTTSGAYVSALKMAMRMTLKSLIIIKGDTTMVKNGLPAIHPGEFLAEILGTFGKECSHETAGLRKVSENARGCRS